MRYPLAASGMYYRAIAIASLGLSVGVGAALGRRPVWAWILAVVALADNTRSASGLWPMGVVDLSLQHTQAELLAAGSPGPVVVLPTDGDSAQTERMLLLGALCGRPLSSSGTVGHAAPLATQVELDLLQGRDPRQTLTRAGYVAIVVNPEEPIYGVVARKLGPPDGPGIWWVD
jgi:hypothetical protein